MKMHFIYFSIVACVTLAVAIPALEDRVSLSIGSVEARELAPPAANERRQVDGSHDSYDDRDGSSGVTFSDRRSLPPAQLKDKRQWDWIYDDDEDLWDDWYGDFDIWVSENTAKRRALEPSGAKDKRQFDWFYDDEDSYYDDWVGDFNGGVSNNAAKSKA